MPGHAIENRLQNGADIPGNPLFAVTEENQQAVGNARRSAAGRPTLPPAVPLTPDLCRAEASRGRRLPPPCPAYSRAASNHDSTPRQTVVSFQSMAFTSSVSPSKFRRPARKAGSAHSTAPPLAAFWRKSKAAPGLPLCAAYFLLFSPMPAPATTDPAPLPPDKWSLQRRS